MGAAVGAWVSNEGASVGALVGAAVGTSVGTLVGTLVTPTGASVGAAVGTAVGTLVTPAGTPVGTAVGTLVGTLVGTPVGASVGTAVSGAAVATPPPHSQHACFVVKRISASVPGALQRGGSSTTSAHVFPRLECTQGEPPESTWSVQGCTTGTSVGGAGVGGKSGSAVSGGRVAKAPPPHTQQAVRVVWILSRSVIRFAQFVSVSCPSTSQVRRRLPRCHSLPSCKVWSTQIAGTRVPGASVSKPPPQKQHASYAVYHPSSSSSSLSQLSGISSRSSQVAPSIFHTSPPDSV